MCSSDLMDCEVSQSQPHKTLLSLVLLLTLKCFSHLDSVPSKYVEVHGEHSNGHLSCLHNVLLPDVCTWCNYCRFVPRKVQVMIHLYGKCVTNFKTANSVRLFTWLRFVSGPFSIYPLCTRLAMPLCVLHRLAPLHQCPGFPQCK